MCKSGSVPPPPQFSNEERELLKEQKLTMEQFRDMLGDESLEKKETQDLLKNVSGLYKEEVTKGADTRKTETVLDQAKLDAYGKTKMAEINRQFPPGTGGNPAIMRRTEAVNTLNRELNAIKANPASMGFTKTVETGSLSPDEKKMVLDKDAVGKLKGRIGETIEYDERLRKDAQDFLSKEINAPKNETELRQERIADLQSRIAENALRQEAGLPPLPLPAEAGEPGGPEVMPGVPGGSAAQNLLPAGWTPEMVAEQQGLDKKNLGLATLQADRQERALRGLGPVSEGTTQRKTQEFALFKEQMARAGHVITGDSLESAVGESTAAVQALDAFKKRYALVEDAERQGELQSGAGLNLAQSGFIEQLTQGREAVAQQKIDARLGRNLNQSGYVAGQNQQDFTNAYNVRNLTNRPAGSELSYVGAAQEAGPAGLLQYYGSLPGMYGGAMQPYTDQRMLGYQGQIQNAQNKNSMWNSLIGGATNLGAAYMLMSSKSFKKNIEPVDPKEEDRILDLVKKGTSYRFDYKTEKESSKRRHLGMLAEEAPDHIRSPDGKHIDIGNHLGFLTSAVRALSRRVDGVSARKGA